MFDKYYITYNSNSLKEYYPGISQGMPGISNFPFPTTPCYFEVWTPSKPRSPGHFEAHGEVPS